jgi:inositol-pentakisphosphate 2-kinase
MSSNDSDPHSDPEKCMEILQRVPLTLHYLTEGNANVIYSIAPNTTDPNLALHDHCCVLRMRKDLPTTRPTLVNMTAIRDRITPLFGPEHVHNLMPKALYPLTEEVLQQADQILQGLDEHLAKSHAGSRVPAGRGPAHPPLNEEPHAVLMPNLRHGDHTLFHEFKPKWLHQSPSAPADARRCRTCATNALKRLRGGKKGKGDSGFCPFDLLSDDRAIIKSIVQKIDPEHGSSDWFVDAFIQQVQPVIRHLAILQAEHNTEGLDDPKNTGARDYAVAMALRDCSLFLVLAKTAQGRLKIADVKLADLDLKSMTPENLKKWAKAENELITSGAYTSSAMPGSACALERQLG